MEKYRMLFICVVLTCIFEFIGAQGTIRHGGWSPPSFSSCSATCSGGTQNKILTCDNPLPQNGGDLCALPDGSRSDEYITVEKCNEISCFAGEYTEWSDCGDCAIGEHTKYALCGEVNCDVKVNPPITEACSTWVLATCPSPCVTRTCPQYSECVDKSTETGPDSVCECRLGYTMNKDETACIRPPPVKPTPRPIPVLPPAQKTVATVMSKTASTVLIVFVSATLLLFLVLRIFTVDRIIQMNMEIALLLAHIFLIFPPTTSDNEELCRVVSILIHFFFTACYVFIMLEALHMYSLVAYVVRQDGMFSKFQNTLIGWSLAASIVLLSVCFQFENYGGKYHCWLQMDTPLLYAHLIPVITFVVITLTLIEGAGSSDGFKPLKKMDFLQRTSAKFSQRTNLVILPFMLTHWILGMLAEYEQNLALYGTFSVVNGILGGLVFFFHCSNNQQVRDKMSDCWKSVRGKKTSSAT